MELSDRFSDGEAGSASMRSRTWSSMRSRGDESLPSAEEVGSPFPGLEVDLSGADLRETAYEVLVCATVVSNGEVGSGGSKSPGGGGGGSSSSPHSSPAHSAVRRLKKALTIKSRRRSGELQCRDLDIARSQMEISERRDQRIRKALSRAAEQSGNRAESLIVPLELLLNLGSSDFSNSHEYQRWQKRQLKVLEAGLLYYPHSVHENSDSFASQFKKTLAEIRDRHLKGSKYREALQSLKLASTGLAGEDCLWASGFPLNVHLYDMLLRSLFDSLEEGSFIFEMDQVLELVKKTWGILGITEFLHHVCFMWVLFRQFIVTGQTEAELLRTAEVELREARRCHPGGASLEADLLASILSSVQGWCETRLLAYHQHFSRRDVRALDGLASLSILADELLNQQVLQESTGMSLHTARIRADEYIQGSVQSSFAQINNEVLSECGAVSSVALIELAKNVAQLALEEEESFSPIFKQWHPCPARLAASTLHECFMRELKFFLGKSSDEAGKDVLRVLESGGMLEKQLMKMRLESELNSGECVPLASFASDALVNDILKTWLEENLQNLAEWVHRNVQQEDWSSDALREHYAMSGVEVLRMIEDLLDAFFALPVYENPKFLTDLISGVNSVLERYAFLTVAGCEPREVTLFSERRMLPPSLLKSSSFLNRMGEALKKRSETLTTYRNKVWPQLSEVEVKETAGREIEHLCVRMNTLYYIQSQMEFLEKKIRYGWQELVRTSFTLSENKEPEKVKFWGARSYCHDGINKLYQFIAYKTIFCDMRQAHWEMIYSSRHYRVKPAVEFLNSQLMKVAESSSDWLRDRLVKQIMKGCFEAFVQVVSYRASPEMMSLFEEDFGELAELFKAGGEGLSEELVDQTAQPVFEFMKSLQRQQQEQEQQQQQKLEQQQQQQQQQQEEENKSGEENVNSSSNGKSIDLEVNFRMMFTRSKSPPVPQGLQHLTNTNAFATALGYRCHSLASKFVKRSIDLSTP